MGIQITYTRRKTHQTSHITQHQKETNKEEQKKQKKENDAPHTQRTQPSNRQAHASQKTIQTDHVMSSLVVVLRDVLL